jgi:hypothetical protein
MSFSASSSSSAASTCSSGGRTNFSCFAAAEAGRDVVFAVVVFFVAFVPTPKESFQRGKLCDIRFPSL